MVALEKLAELGLVVLYEVDGSKYGQIEGYDDDAPYNLRTKRGKAEYPDPPKSPTRKKKSRAPKGRTKDALKEPKVTPDDAQRTPPDIDIDIDIDKKRESAGERAPLPGPLPLITPGIDQMTDGTKRAAKDWLSELDEQRRTQTPGKRNYGVLAAMGGGWEGLSFEFCPMLAKIVDEYGDQVFCDAVESMIRGGKGWGVNPTKYLWGAAKIAADNRKPKRRRSVRKVGPEPLPASDNQTVDLADIPENMIEWYGVDRKDWEKAREEARTSAST